MRSPSQVRLQLRDHHPAPEPFVADVLKGLRDSPKRISPMYFYDALGSELFDRICELKEYYPTRTELRILEQHGNDIARCIGDDALLVRDEAGDNV